MLDNMGSFPCPGIEQRKRDALHETREYSYLYVYQNIIDKAIREVNTDCSEAGYYMFIKKEMIDNIIQMCKVYKKNILNKFLVIIRCKRLARRLRLRIAETYAPGGMMYNRLCRSTLVGKKSPTIKYQQLY